MSQTSQTVDLEVFYPYPPERVWQVLTDRRTLAAWMMENDFEPRVGHKFRFYSQPVPGLKLPIQCEVVELEAPTRLVYTWQESPTAERSLVIWTLTAVANGTQLRLKHHQHSYAAARAAFGATFGATCNQSGSQSGSLSATRNSQGATGFYSHSHTELLDNKSFSGASALDSLYHPSVPSKTQFVASDLSTLLALTQWQSFTWDYFLNQTLPQVLLQVDSSDRSNSLPNKVLNELLN